MILEILFINDYIPKQHTCPPTGEMTNRCNPYTGIIFSNKNGWTVDILSNMDELLTIQEALLSGGKARLKSTCFYGPVIWNARKCHITYDETKQVGVPRALGMEDIDLEGAQGIVGAIKMFCFLIMMVLHRYVSFVKIYYCTHLK